MDLLFFTIYSMSRHAMTVGGKCHPEPVSGSNE